MGVQERTAPESKFEKLPEEATCGGNRQQSADIEDLQDRTGQGAVAPLSQLIHQDYIEERGQGTCLWVIRVTLMSVKRWTDGKEDVQVMDGTVKREMAPARS